MAQLVSIRTNTKFNFDYKTKRLVPEVELIFLVGQPHYEIEKNGIVKKPAIKEVRINTSIEDIAEIIGQLQATQAGLATISNMSAAFNTIIEHSETNKK